MDILKLDYERKKRNISIDDFCKAINMSKGAYYRRRKGVSDFTQKEIEAIVDFLNLGTPMGIFFEEKVT